MSKPTKINKAEKKDNSIDCVIKNFCVKCNRDTNHKIISNYRIDESAEFENGQFDISWFDDYQIVICLGCDTVSFIHNSWFSEDWDPETNGLNTTIYPERKQKEPLVLADITPDLDCLYKEVINAYNSGAYILASVGIRGMLEGLCKAKNIKRGKVPVEVKGEVIMKSRDNIEGKIYGLLDAGHITEKHVDIMNHLRVLGNYAIHEIEQPKMEQVDIALRIIESMFEVVFGLEKKGELLRQFRELS